MGSVDVSVIVPTYRREELVVSAVRSALAQEGVELEVIVLDDTAEGTAREAIASIGDPRVQYVKRQTPSGGRPSLVRNEGANLARGQFVHCLDDDDELVQGALAALRAPLAKDPAIAVSFGVVLPFGEDASALAHEQAYFARAAASARRAPDRHAFARGILFGTSPLVSSSCLIRRDALLDLGGFNASMRVCEDFELFARAIRRHGGVFVDAPVLWHRISRSSLSHSASREQTLDAFRVIYDSYRRDFGPLELLAMRARARIDKLVERAAGA